MKVLSIAAAGLIGLFSLTAQAQDKEKGKEKVCELSIEGNDQMQFNKKELVIESGCTEVSLTLKHVGKQPKAVMGHNVVITKAGDMQAVVADAAKAGLAADYTPKGDKRIVATTKLIGGGESTTVKFSVDVFKAGNDYKFFCSFPGHFALMQGQIVIKAFDKKS